MRRLGQMDQMVVKPLVANTNVTILYFHSHDHYYLSKKPTTRAKELIDLDIPWMQQGQQRRNRLWWVNGGVLDIVGELLSLMIFGLSCSSSRWLLPVSRMASLSIVFLIVIKYSGRAGVWKDTSLIGDIESDVDRFGYRAGSCRIVSYFFCIWEVRWDFTIYLNNLISYIVFWIWRYGEGRKLWTNITVASRNLAYMVRRKSSWISCIIDAQFQ